MVIDNVIVDVLKDEKTRQVVLDRYNTYCTLFNHYMKESIDKSQFTNQQIYHKADEYAIRQMKSIYKGEKL